VPLAPRAHVVELGYLPLELALPSFLIMGRVTGFVGVHLARHGSPAMGVMGRPQISPSTAPEDGRTREISYVGA